MDYRITIKDMPQDQRPRERLLREGPEVLTDSELLAILLHTGTKKNSALDLATKIISSFGGLRELLSLTQEELLAVHGVGLAKVAQIKAALELGRRVSSSHIGERPQIRCPEDVAGLVMEEMRHLDREHFVVLALNTKNQVLMKETVSIGTLNSSLVHPREVFKNALRRSAAAVILVHNHPSGDPTPSGNDIKITQQLQEAGNIVGIQVLDHIVIGDNTFIGLKAKGII